MNRRAKIVGLMVSLAAPAALGDSIMCNKKQTRCVIDNRDLTIGDEVGVFTPSNELVAVGVVKAMNGHRRAVEMTENNGTIRKNHRLALLERTASESGQAAPEYRIYRDASPYIAGGSLSFATVGIGNGSPATELSAMGAVRKWNDLEVGGRLTYLGMEGEVSRISLESDGIETKAVSVKGFGVLGSAGYTWLRNNTLSARGEAGLGFMFVSATVGGNAGDVSGAGYDTNVSNGFGTYLRAGASGQYAMKDWKLELGLAQSMIHNAMATSLGFGVLKDIR